MKLKHCLFALLLAITPFGTVGSCNSLGTYWFS